MSRSRRIFGIALAAVIVLVLAAGTLAKIRNNARANDTTNTAGGDRPDVSAMETFAADVPIPVEGTPVVVDTLVISVSAAGNAAAMREWKVTNQVGGRVQSVSVRDADRVARGRVLVRLDSIDHAFEVRQRRADLAAKEAAYRVETLFDERITDPEVRAERERAARIKSGLDQAEVSLQQAELNLQRVTIRAPFAGVVADVKAVPGAYIQPNADLMTVQELDPIKVEVNVLESEVGFLQAGSRASVRFSAYPGEDFLGRIMTINPVVDRDTRTARVTVHVPNPNGRILPGMYARVSLEARKFPNRILVPRAAVLERDQRRTLVFVVEDERAKWRYVVTGLGNEHFVELLPDDEYPPPRAGEVVLVSGHHTLTHDARITLVDNVRQAGGRPQ
ncbi:MAG TPA: efflux RND transporter periplasmic adaptor subunit [Gemmatimonadaceae bacterium]|nr:efflux RND transporter periplasmic adaptor subunit [Gemmatimonadaceae bacterium]